MNDSPTDPRSDGGPEPTAASNADPIEHPSAACRATSRLLARLVAGELGDDHARRLRAHVEDCEPCGQAYRETVEAVAGVGRRVREEREQARRERRHEGLRQRAMAATAEPKRGRRHGLKLALLPAAIALLILIWRGGAGDRTLVASWEAGPASVAGEALGADHETYRLSRGDWCTTGAEGGMRITSAPHPDVELVLAPDTRVEVEDLRLAQVRLERGTLETLGPCRVITVRGVLTQERGRARIAVSGDGVELQCLEGSSTWFGPAGERRLKEGEGISKRASLALRR